MTRLRPKVLISFLNFEASRIMSRKLKRRRVYIYIYISREYSHMVKIYNFICLQLLKREMYVIIQKEKVLDQEAQQQQQQRRRRQPEQQSCVDIRWKEGYGNPMLS